MAHELSRDIVFGCLFCRMPLVASSAQVGAEAMCSHCHQLFTVPASFNVVDDATVSPGVRRITLKAPAVNPLLAELEAMTQAYAEAQEQLAAVREELQATRVQEAETARQLDARIQDLQRQLDRVIKRLAGAPVQNPL